jgi:hypothetical protein
MGRSDLNLTVETGLKFGLNSGPDFSLDEG